MPEEAFRGAIDPHTPVAQSWLRATHWKLDPKRSKPPRGITHWVTTLRIGPQYPAHVLLPVVPTL